MQTLEDAWPKDPKNPKMVELDHTVKMEDTWKAMEKLVEEGLVKSIGVSKFPMSLTLDLLSYAKIKPVVNQVECQPFLNQAHLIEQLGRFGILVQG